MNLVAIIGNAATKPELRHTPAGKAICEFRIAVNRPGGTDADFFNVITWERQAEVVNEYVTTGRRIAVEGRLHHSSWQTDAGEKRSKVEIIAHRVELLGSKPATETEGTSEPAEADVPAW